MKTEQQPIIITIDEELVETYNRTFQYDEIEPYKNLAGVNFAFEHEKGLNLSGVGYIRFSDGTVSVRNPNTDEHTRVPMSECTIMPRDKKSRRHMAAADFWKENLTIGSIIKEWGKSNFHAMVMGIDGNNFHWIELDSKALKEGQISFHGSASISGIGKIETALIGELSWGARMQNTVSDIPVVYEEDGVIIDEDGNEVIEGEVE
ncbi:hypothetical protein DSS3PM1_00016 [Bacteriophage DSS3_PM1]|nr:hypothetical protein DSS3PM1_00016 [Bacteriophage DSS3_PM1]